MRFREGFSRYAGSNARDALRLITPLALLVSIGVTSTGFLLHNALQFIASDELRWSGSGAGTGEAGAAHIMSVRIQRTQRSTLPAHSADAVPGAAVADSANIAPAVEKDRAGIMQHAAQTHGKAKRKVAKAEQSRVARGPAEAKSAITYRTVCVRECDGGYFPISFSTRQEFFARDQAACSSRCAVPARLFVYPLDGGSPESMVGLDGTPYSALANANVFRSELRAACSCQKSPMQQDANIRRSLPIAGDPAPVIGGIDTDPADRPTIEEKFQTPFKSASVIHDATGRPVMLKPQSHGTVKPAVTLIARAVEPIQMEIAAAPVETAAFPDQPVHAGPAVPASVAQVEESFGAPEPPATQASRKQVSGKAGKAAAATKAQRKLALEKLANGQRAVRGATRTASGDDLWYGRRLYTGNDWRLVTFQTLE